jgi:hypothetical protein
VSKPHTAILSLKLNAPARASVVNWKDFFSPRTDVAKGVSPIDEFYLTHEHLNVLSGLASDRAIADHLRPLLADQMLLGYVSATEQYIRRLLAASVRLCPYLRARNANQQIFFSAVDYYSTEEIEHALTERVSFSEPGKVKSALDQRLAVSVAPNSSLERAISEYEQLCQLRHALVHSRGIVNSSNAQGFDLPKSKSQYNVSAGPLELQSAASVCIDLVRELNERTAQSVLWGWLNQGLLTGQKQKDRRRLQNFLETYSSATDTTGGTLPSLEDLHRLTTSVLDDLAKATAKRA